MHATLQLRSSGHETTVLDFDESLWQDNSWDKDDMGKLESDLGHNPDPGC